MAATNKSNPLISPSLIDSIQTSVDAAKLSSRGVSHETVNPEAWQRLIDYQLNEWKWDTDQFEDEGIEALTRDTIQLAIAVAEKLRDAGLAPPDSVVPDANGGIVFERREKDVSEVFHVWDDGTIEYQCFHGTRLTERRSL
jgi:hypothetical protein